MSHTFQTTLIWHDSTGSEIECEAIVEYDRFPGFAGDRIDPAEAERVEIVGVTPVNKDYNIPDSAIDIDALAEEAMEDWRADDEDAAEYRAEQARDDRMMGEI